MARQFIIANISNNELEYNRVSHWKRRLKYILLNVCITDGKKFKGALNNVKSTQSKDHKRWLFLIVVLSFLQLQLNEISYVNNRTAINIQLKISNTNSFSVDKCKYAILAWTQKSRLNCCLYQTQIYLDYQRKRLIFHYLEPHYKLSVSAWILMQWLNFLHCFR